MLTASQARLLHVAHDYGHTKKRIERLIQLSALNFNVVIVTVQVAEVNPITHWLTGLGYSVTKSTSSASPEVRLCVRW